MRLARAEVSAYERPDLVREIDQLALQIMLRWVGDGELRGGGWNNRGPKIEWWRANDGTGGAAHTRGAWCASVQSAADVLAARELGLRLPHATSRSAKRYTRSVAAAGWWVARPRGPWGVLGVDHLDAPRPGDRICWHRGDLKRPDTRRRGHVARVLEYDGRNDSVRIVEGNRNNRTDSRGRRYSVVAIRKIYDWRRRLYGIARLG